MKRRRYASIIGYSWLFVVCGSVCLADEFNSRSLERERELLQNRPRLFGELKAICQSESRLRGNKLIPLFRACEATKDENYVEQLLCAAKVLSVAPEKSYWQDYTLEPLHAADALGDIDETLVAYARDWRKNRVLALNSILILARQPSPQSMQILDVMLAESPNDQFVKACVERVKRAEKARKHYNEAGSVALQLQILLKELRIDYYHEWGRFHGRSRYLPTGIWAQKTLRQVSEQHPHATIIQIKRWRPYEKRAYLSEVQQKHKAYVLRNYLLRECNELFEVELKHAELSKPN